MTRAGFGGQSFEAGEQLVVDEVQQAVAGQSFGVSGHVSPAEFFRDGLPILFDGDFLFLLTVVKDLQEEEPGELPESLCVSIDASVFSHDVVDGFDGGGVKGHTVSKLSVVNESGFSFERDASQAKVIDHLLHGLFTSRAPLICHCVGFSVGMHEFRIFIKPTNRIELFRLLPGKSCKAC